MKIFAFSLFFLILGLFGSQQIIQFVESKPASDSNEEKVFFVRPGDNYIAVISRLKKNNLIYDARIMRWYINYLYPNTKLKVGEYMLRPNMSMTEIIDHLSSGKSVAHKFLIPEGHNIFQIATKLEAEGYTKAKDILALVRSPGFIQSLELPTLKTGDEMPKSLEGYLYPDTYNINRLMSPKDILTQMVQRFKDVYRKVSVDIGSNELLQKLKLSPHEVITLASVVEKETGAGFERPLIASVFFNRLKIRKRLESDPTTIYGMWERDGFFNGNIRRKDLRTVTPYNTYKISRLPAGPIANPGLNAIKAVLNPSQSDYLYFVSRNNGTHVFTKNFSDHQKAVRLLQKNPKARRGKSWRDLPDNLKAKGS